jgi:hypothetical protein
LLEVIRLPMADLAIVLPLLAAINIAVGISVSMAL